MSEGLSKYGRRLLVDKAKLLAQLTTPMLVWEAPQEAPHEKLFMSTAAGAGMTDRLGLVIFSAVSSTRCPLTVDHSILRGFVEEVDFAPPDEDGTALGMGLATAVGRLRASQARSKVIVLLTDGRNNRGQIGPETAGRMSQALGIRMSTIGVGSEGEARVPVEPLRTERRSGTLSHRISRTSPPREKEMFCTVDGAGSPFTQANDELLIPLAPAPGGQRRARVAVRYGGTPATGLIIARLPIEGAPERSAPHRCAGPPRTVWLPA